MYFGPEKAIGPNLSIQTQEVQIPRSARDDRSGGGGAPLISVAPNIDALDLIEFRRGQVRRKEYKPLGRLLRIMFERSDLERPPDTSPEEQRALMQLIMLDWLKDGPLIGISNDGQDYLVCSAMIYPPDLPDPTWVQPRTPHHYEQGMPIPHIPPRVPQRLRDRTRTVCRGRDGENWLVVQPLTHILLVVAGGLGEIRYVSKATGTHYVDACGRHAALLFDPARQEGHILFGRGEWDVLR